MISWAVLGLCLTQQVTAAPQHSPRQWAECGCFCVAGQAKTLCNSVEEAQQNPLLCDPHKTCAPAAPPLDPPQQPLLPPHPDAHNCERVPIRDETNRTVQQVNICEVRSA